MFDTDIRLAMTAVLRKAMADYSHEFDSRAFFKAATAAAKSVVRKRFEAFGCIGKASRIKPMTMDRMDNLYQKGSLRAQVH
jgi:fructose-bisphosphate aldolase class II